MSENGPRVDDADDFRAANLRVSRWEAVVKAFRRLRRGEKLVVPSGRAGILPQYRATREDRRMLVLSRKSNQALIIDHDVVVTVVEIGDDYVRLAIAAPNEDEIGRRYPKSQDVPQSDVARPIVVTLSLHHGAVLDRLRRQMSDDESTPPSRDEALATLLEAVADADDFVLPRVTKREPAKR